MPTKEEITELAYRRYKSGESYEKSVWYLAYFTEKIKTNIRDYNNSIKPLQSENLILLLNENVNGSLFEPDEEKVRELAERVYSDHPEKSKLHWFIAEKMLLLEEIENIIRKNYDEPEINDNNSE
ncbi:MAG: hypothetical protein BAJALOKI1v1_1610004 [Promethearchaeota archaeon]|nr:MAG: hypothetical protein BAJALOKI1v1_1610004 [Candidatus Lokiarchaeota archaeon]